MLMNNRAALSRLPLALCDAEGVLCHVTPAFNRASILEFGISPDWSQGKMHCCWFCDATRLLWALAHVSNCHCIAVSELAIFSVDFKQRFIRTGLKGVYIRKVVTIPGGFISVSEVISAHEECALFQSW